VNRPSAPSGSCSVGAAVGSDAPSPVPFWHALLRERAIHRWGNFTWVSLNMLLLSGNDRIARLDPTIVDLRRMRWVAAQRARDVAPAAPIRLPSAHRLVAVGDPGEMDASQYVLVRDLVDAKPDVLLLMSDVVYPAGDVNAWRDAVYLPYFGLPEPAWEHAERCAETEVEIPPWHVFASPGNHDWYDGLTGFMFHACGAEPLPRVTSSTAGLTFRQRLTRRLWQDPAVADRAMLAPLRADVAARWKPATAPGPMPWQPGPYFALDLGSVDGVEPAVRIVSVDTGIDGSIDVEQALWIREMLRGSTAKVVVTGKPLAVGDELRDVPVNGTAVRTGARTDHADDAPAAGLRALIAAGERVVATVAGDVHNSQRIVFAGRVAPVEGERCSYVLTLDAEALEQARSLELPPVQIVAGGGGAYLSATHTTPYTAGDGLRFHGDAPLPPEVPAAHHTRFPSREQSVLAYGRRVGRWAGIATAVLGALLLAAAAALAILDEAGPRVCVGRACVAERVAVLAPFALAGLVVFGALTATALRAGRRPVGKIAATVALAVAFWLLWSHEAREAPVLLGGLAFALAAPLLPVLLPLVQTFPAFGRLIPVQAIAVALGGLLLRRFVDLPEPLDNLAILIVALAVAVALLLLARRGIEGVLRWADDRATEREAAGLRGALALASLWPLLLVVAAIFALPGSWDRAHEAAGMIVLIELLALLGFVGLVIARAVWTARRTAPYRMLPAIAFAAVLGGVVAALAAGALGGDAVAIGLLGAAGAVFGAAVALGAVLAAGPEEVSEERVGDALRDRDLRQPAEGLRDRRLFRLMAVAALPGISELAEAAEPPFHKSYLEISYTDEGAVVFEAFGVDDERSARRVDRLEVRLAG
jgi:hypothetical protein